MYVYCVKGEEQHKWKIAEKKSGLLYIIQPKYTSIQVDGI